MEKYRKFADASNGIQPFTLSVIPSLLGKVMTPVMFPIRVLFVLVFGLILLLVDTVVFLLFYPLHLLPLSRYVGLVFLQKCALKGFFFFLGHVLVRERPCEAEGRTAYGDVFFVNCQSVWDAMVVEVLLNDPFVFYCFPKPAATPDGGEGTNLQCFPPSPLQRWRVWWYVYRTGTTPALSALAEQQGFF
ncbi:hypothetical protein AGDE_08865 [Angomonas deanei]|nr:hypothetical protein AGDE_08865 [Angomonas deanei]|eukprot:EPY32101.1 hypothetical protein AGDE_08865 [Angomonas deanei]